MKNRKNDIKETSLNSSSLWDGQHKIPWSDPVFSARILKEHLSQDHDLASRKQQTIEDQAEWIRSRHLQGGPASILDLGCGPGLYSHLLAAGEHNYLGIDFSPASIEYARQKCEYPDLYEFVLGDVVEADFQGPHDLAMMLYGEINVFPPDNCRRILSKAYEALAPGGHVVIEAQSFDTVHGVGLIPDSETKAEAGLFSDSPYVCLTQSTWYEAETVCQQTFQVRADNEADSTTYKSTTKAWTNDELTSMLQTIGFKDVTIHDDWPNLGGMFVLLTGVKR